MASSATRLMSDWISSGVTILFTLGATSTVEPKARIVCIFSSAKASDETKYPR